MFSPRRLLQGMLAVAMAALVATFTGDVATPASAAVPVSAITCDATCPFPGEPASFKGCLSWGIDEGVKCFYSDGEWYLSFGASC